MVLAAADGAGVSGRSPAAAETHPLPGPVRFARYAYPPNALGYCGPDDAAELFGLASVGRDRRGLAALAARFDGAWPYLELIAAANAIPDPLDERVVEAYWLGNALLARVSPGMLLASMRDRFGARAGRDLAHLESSVALGAGPNHSFHVFGVYPWVGLLRGGRHHDQVGATGRPERRQGAALAVLDGCRIRWGSVVAADGECLTVQSRRLEFDGHRLTLGVSRIEVVQRGLDGLTMLADVQPGDVVSLHWDWACEQLTARQLAALRAYTARTLRAVNAAPVPGPAEACNRLGG